MRVAILLIMVSLIFGCSITGKVQKVSELSAKVEGRAVASVGNIYSLLPGQQLSLSDGSIVLCAGTPGLGAQGAVCTSNQQCVSKSCYADNYSNIGHCQ
jgi:hypothetical protein